VERKNQGENGGRHGFYRCMIAASTGPETLQYLKLIRGEERGMMPMLVRGSLRLASIPYGLGVCVRNWLFDRDWKSRYAAAVPVISVGNLTLGGTGKTPCVEYLARWFRARDMRVALLSRGYGSAGGGNDEALVLEENLPDVPHLQGHDRAALARIAVTELESEVLILDDGFQHRRLRRDLDLVLVDATCPWGQGYLFPRGLLREPPASLRRADMVLLTRCDQAEDTAVADIRQCIARLAPGVPVMETRHRPASWINASRHTLSLADLAVRPVAGFCGIGNPDAFLRTLEQCGCRVVAWRTFADHHGYTRGDIDDLGRWAAGLPADAGVVTTQKDLVKIRLDRLGGREVWALKIALQVMKGQETLEEKLLGLKIGVGEGRERKSD